MNAKKWICMLLAAVLFLQAAPLAALPPAVAVHVTVPPADLFHFVLVQFPLLRHAGSPQGWFLSFYPVSFKDLLRL